MRIALVSLLCTLGLTATSGTALRADDQADIKKELKKFQGAWTFESIETGGMKLPTDQFKGMIVLFEGDKYSVRLGDQVVEAATLKLDPSKSPKTLDSTVIEGPNKGNLILGIYEIDADTLKACFDPEGKKRPTEFKASGTQTLVIHKRAKK